LAQVLAAADPDLPLAAGRAALSERAGSQSVRAKRATRSPVALGLLGLSLALGRRGLDLSIGAVLPRGQVTVSVARSIANCSLAIVSSLRELL
jgi:hypothetical protein